MQKHGIGFQVQQLSQQTHQRKVWKEETDFLKEQVLILQMQNKKQTIEFSIVNHELLCQAKEQKEQVVELSILNTALQKSLQIQQEHVTDLEKMLFAISHEVRQPIAQILGLSALLDNLKVTPAIKTMLGYLKQSASSLDNYTRQLTIYLGTLIDKIKPK